MEVNSDNWIFSLVYKISRAYYKMPINSMNAIQIMWNRFYESTLNFDELKSNPSFTL